MRKCGPFFLWNRFSPLFSCLVFSGLLLCSCCIALAAGIPAALVSDPPADHAHPPFLASMEIASHGQLLNALMYVAAGRGPHPAAILLSGFPGNERNLDLAQAMRRAGWNVLYFNYRGSWGTSGAFTFTHCIEDAQSAVAFLRDPGNAQILRTDPSRIVLIGHSLGGFIAAYVGAHDSSILAVGLISAANPSDMGAAQGAPSVAVPRLSAHFARFDLQPLSGCTPLSLARETIDHREQWNFHNYMPLLADRPVLLITANDGLNGHAHALARSLRRHGSSRVLERHFNTDHSYSSERIALQATVLGWLKDLYSSPPAPENAGMRKP